MRLFKPTAKDVQYSDFIHVFIKTKVYVEYASRYS